MLRLPATPYPANDPTPNVDVDQSTATANRESGVKRYYAQQLQTLIESAAEDGFVLTIALEPVVPLAMGNYVMRGHVRGAR